jgi:hypothetical protein
MVERVLAQVKDVFEKSSFVGKGCWVDFKITLKSFHEVRHVRVLSLPHNETVNKREEQLKAVFMRVLEKKKRDKSGVFLSAFAIIRSILNNRFEVVDLGFIINRLLC